MLLFAAGDKVARGAAFEGAVRPPGIPPADFGLRDEDGKVVALADLRGRPVVVTFLYTTCEDTCPLTVDQIRGGLDELGHDVPGDRRQRRPGQRHGPRAPSASRCGAR